MSKLGGSRIVSRLGDVRERIGGIEFKQIEPKLKVLLILLALFAFFHLHELTNFTLSIDDEVAALREDPRVWLTQGRWATYLFEKFVLPQPVLPFLPLALFGLFSSIGYLFFLEAIGESRFRPLLLVWFPLFASFPTWSFLTAFQSNTPCAGLGVLFSCWAALVFRKGRERSVGRDSSLSIAGAGLIGAIAIGCYQSFSLFIAVVLFAVVIAMSLGGRLTDRVTRDCFAAVAVLAVALVLYALIMKLFLLLSGESVSYIQNFIRLQELQDNPRTVVSNVLQQMQSIYFGWRLVYGYASPAIVVLIVLAIVGVVHHAYGNAGPKGGFFAGLAILTLLVTPFGMNLMSGGDLPPLKWSSLKYDFRMEDEIDGEEEAYG